MISVYTLVSEDGVVGLNGRQWLLDDQNELMQFTSEEEARAFLENAGTDPDDEFIGYELEEEN